MTNLLSIAKREIQSYFASPIAYVVLGSFAFLFALFFYPNLLYFAEQSRSSGTGPLNVNEDLINWLFRDTSVLVLFLVPLLTMRTFSEEIRSGTIELLLTSPLSDFQIVLGKFLGALALYSCMLALTLVHMGLLFYLGDPEWKPLAVGYLGMLLLGGSFVSFGLLFSSMTRNQIVAAFLSFGAFLILWLVAYAERWAGPAASLVSYLSVTQHIESFAKGVLDTRDLVYYVSFAALGLFLCKQSIESFRWRG